MLVLLFSTSDPLKCHRYRCVYKKLSYYWETARRESKPRIAEMDDFAGIEFISFRTSSTECVRSSTTQISDKIRTHRRSRSLKVIDLGAKYQSKAHMQLPISRN